MHLWSPVDWVEQAQMRGGFEDDPVTVHVKVAVWRRGCKPVQLKGLEGADG